MTAHMETLGNLEVKVLPDRAWAVLTIEHGGARNSVRFTAADLTDAIALLQTAGAWLADRYGDTP